MERDDDPGRSLVESGAAVAGSMTRTAAALAFDDPAPPAAVRLHERFAACVREAAGAAGTVPVERERVRAGAVLAFAVEHAVTLDRGGRPVRSDGFFTGTSGRRPPAAELFEAVVAAARHSVDELRVRHLGCLLAELSVSPDLDVPLAARVLREAERLSWRQLALLAGVGRRDRVPLPMAPLDDEPRAWTTWGAREDVADLQRNGLVDPPPATLRPGGPVRPRLRAADLRLTRRGVLVHRLLALDYVRDDAVAAALAALGLPRS